MKNLALLQAKLEEELKPLTQLLTDIERRVTAGEEIPDFGTLAAWAANEARRSGAGPQAARRAGGSRGAAAEARIDVSIEGQPSLLTGGQFEFSIRGFEGTFEEKSTVLCHANLYLVLHA